MESYDNAGNLPVTDSLSAIAVPYIVAFRGPTRRSDGRGLRKRCTRQQIRFGRPFLVVILGGRHSADEANMKSSVVSTNARILGGVPVFSGTRVPIRILNEYLEAGDGLEDFLDQFPSVSREQALQLMGQTPQTMPSHTSEIAP